MFWLALLLAYSLACKWQVVERANPEASVDLFFALPYSNSEESSALLRSVSDPNSPQYRNFPSVETVAKLIAPTDTVRARVNSFILARFPLLTGRWRGFGHNFHLHLSVAQVEEMLRTECYVYSCSNNPNITTIRTVNQTFPEFELTPHLAYIGGVTQFPLQRLGVRAPLMASKQDSDSPVFRVVLNADNSQHTPLKGDSGKQSNVHMRAFHNVMPSPKTRLASSSSSSSSSSSPFSSLLSPAPSSISSLSTSFASSIRSTWLDFLRLFSPSSSPSDPPLVNPFVRLYGDDAKVSVQVQIICPDGTASVMGMCADGPTFAYLRIRYKGGSDAQNTQTIDSSYCQNSLEMDYCLFGLRLGANYMLYAFGVDLHFSGGESYSYDLQGQYVVGEAAKSPTFFRRYYDIADSLASHTSTNYQAVAALTLNGDAMGYYSPSDLQLFANTFNLKLGHVDMKGIPNDPTRPDMETQLDIQWIAALGEGSRSSIFHDEAMQSFENIIEQLQAAAASHQPYPKVLSVSYGAPESSQGGAINSLEEGFKSLGLLGITVLIASGDAGAFWDDCSKFDPGYPATSQYVTSVGATQLVAQMDANGKCRVEEAACSVGLGSLITSGGGFSQVIPQPYWQQDAVAAYVKQAVNTSFPFDPTKRAFPDLAVFGHNYNIVHNAQVASIDGTSASSPAFAGVLTLINDVLLQDGSNRSLGFLNPLLYQMFANHSDAFHDITQGTNGCRREACCNGLRGFPAAKGWDPVTGVGSPVFARFAEYAGVKSPGTTSPFSYPNPDCTVPVVEPYTFWSPWVISAVVAGCVVAICMTVGCISMCRKRMKRREYSLQEPLLKQ